MLNVSIPSQEKDFSPKIIVIGVGGAGGNAVDNMISSDLDGVEFMICNTDAQALAKSICTNRVQLGMSMTKGLGAGSNPEVGRAAAEEAIDEVIAHLDGVNMAFITCGMGGGTGTGAAPIIAQAAKEKGILTVGVVTKPFHFEGGRRMKIAEEGIEEMQNYVDTLIVIPNQNLFRIANEKTTFAEAFKMADGVLQSGVRGVTDLMVRPGMINLDFADVRCSMMEMGKAMMGTGEASGDKRAIEAAEAAINNPLLDDVSMKGASGVIINITGGYDMTLFEADEACNRIRDEVDPEANIIFGSTFDDKLEGTMRVSVVATGIEGESARKSKPLRPASVNPINITTPETGVEAPQRGTPNTVSTTSQPQQGTSASYTAPSAPSIPSAPQVGPDGGHEAMPKAVGAENMSFHGQQETSMTGLSQTFGTGQIPMAGPASAPSAPQVGHASTADAPRGVRYKSSFIPPKPVEADDLAPSYGHAPQQPVAAPKPEGLKLNPPTMPRPQDQKKGPSIFDRFTDVYKSFRGDDDADLNAINAKEETKGESGSTGGSTSGGYGPTFAQPSAPVAPQNMGVDEGGQGRLDVTVPQKPAAEKKEQDLDIPAFLRRQAN